jgi:hypothetical protein
MPICIECSYPVSHLYTSYSKADDRALGKGVRLTQCPRCKRFADKYVEHDNVVLFIDLVLIKPQVCLIFWVHGMEIRAQWLTEGVKFFFYRFTDTYSSIAWEGKMTRDLTWVISTRQLHCT